MSPGSQSKLLHLSHDSGIRSMERDLGKESGCTFASTQIKHNQFLNFAS